MSTVWRLRIASLVGIWLAAVGALALMDMRPAVVALAAITAAAGAVLFVVLDLGDVAAPVDWRAVSDAGTSIRGADARVGVLRRQIADGRVLDGPSTLHRSLVELVDDALRTHHRIDRTMQPAQARAVLGDELVRFVEGTGAAATLADPARLSVVLDRLEALTRPAAVPADLADHPDAGRRPVTQERA